jgi:hypothetical protein
VGGTRLLALTQLETVGLWAGLLSSVVSVVLSLVAIFFARDVDRRSIEISNQTIRSLQSIQSTVQRLSEDTGGLIKVAWERMLGTMGGQTAQTNNDLQGLLAGLIAEFREDANEIAPGTGVEKLARTVGERVRRATDGKSGAERGSGPRSWTFNAVVQAIESLSPLAIELLRALEGGHHLTRTQYQRLRRDPDLAVAIDELRDEDLLVPLQRRGARGDETIYGIAPWFLEVIGAALVFTGHETPSEAEAQKVRSALREVGFDVDDLSEQSEQEDERPASRTRGDAQPSRTS